MGSVEPPLSVTGLVSTMKVEPLTPENCSCGMPSCAAGMRTMRDTGMVCRPSGVLSTVTMPLYVPGTRPCGLKPTTIGPAPLPLVADNVIHAEETEAVHAPARDDTSSVCPPAGTGAATKY